MSNSDSAFAGALQQVDDYGVVLIKTVLFRLFTPYVGFPDFLLWGMNIEERLVADVLKAVRERKTWDKYYLLLNFIYRGELDAPEQYVRAYIAMAIFEVLANDYARTD